MTSLALGSSCCQCAWLIGIFCFYFFSPGCSTANDCPIAPLCLNATCNSGVCGTESAGTCLGSINESNLAGNQGTEYRYQLEALDGVTSVAFQMFGGTGDADLYVKLGSAPTLSSYDCRPWTTGNNESCNFNSPGIYHVMVHGYSSFSGVSLQGSHNGAQDNQPPNAGFSYAVTGLQVAFTDESTDIDGTITSHSWVFGDGNTSMEQSPTHNYQSAGSYTVMLVVTDNGGLTSNSVSQTVTTCIPKNQSPPDNDCSKCCNGRGCRRGRCR